MDYTITIIENSDSRVIFDVDYADGHKDRRIFIGKNAKFAAMLCAEDEFGRVLTH
jgi:hypothetical protein